MSQLSHEEQLDEIFIEFFQCFASLRAYRTQLSKHMSAGFFAFAEARHSQQHLMLDSSSYAGRAMTPSVKVNIDDKNTFHLSVTESVDSSSQSSDTTPMVRKRVFNLSSAKGERERKLDKLIEKAAQRSRRNLDPNASDHSDHSDSDSDNENNDNDSSDAPALDLSRNPLMWFGVLAPPQVKQSQKEFSAALTDAIEIATLHAKLAKLADRFEELNDSIANNRNTKTSDELSQDLSKVSLHAT